MTVTITADCTACGVCIATCPPRALAPARRRPGVDPDRCTDCLACLEVCPVDAIRPQPDDAAHPAGARPPTVHPIEEESYRILHQRVDLRRWPEAQRAVVARMIHATADPSFASTTRIGENAVAVAVDALRRRVPIVCDSRMVVAGIPSLRSDAVCLLDQAIATGSGDTRSAAAIRWAARRYPYGAVWVIGNAPTALTQLLQLHAAGSVMPAVVIGLPVGYVGAAAAKVALWSSSLRPIAITNVDERGGSAVAAAATNALHRLAQDV
jgi:precorrin-8X/cobalt-precorrin-8 methylmutase